MTTLAAIPVHPDQLDLLEQITDTDFVAAFWAQVDRSDDGCQIWRGTVNSNGRGRFGIQGRNYYAYRIAWMMAHRQLIPAGMCACHHCDNPLCVNPDHIFIGSQKDNMQDMATKGRGGNKVLCGDENPKALPSSTMRAVRADYLSGEHNQSELARKYDVSISVVRRWITGARTDSGPSILVAPESPPCGTRRGFRAHVKAREEPCVECRAADNAYQRETYRLRQLRAAR